MQRAEIPTRFLEPFGYQADPSTIRSIPLASQIPFEAGAASLEDGFPPLTQQPEGSGGVPPFGQDFNGLLFQVTGWAHWQAAGGPVSYNAAWSAQNGGYPQGAVLSHATIVGAFWISTVDDNTSNPDTGGANWTLAAPFRNSPPVGSAVNLAGSAPGGTKLAAWTVSELIAATALGGFGSFKGSSLTLNFDGNTTGAGGMDTGSMPTNGDFYVYAMFNPSTGAWAPVGTVASSGPTYTGGNAPAGYTASCLIWTGKTTGTNFRQFQQIDHRVVIASVEIISGGTAIVPTGRSISAAVPAIAKTCSGYFNIINGTNGDAFLGTSSSMLGIKGISASSGGNGTAAPFDNLFCPGQQIFQQTTGTVQSSIVISDYTF